MEEATIDSIADIDLDLYRRVAWGGVGVRLAAPLLAERSEVWREFLAFVGAHQDDPIYGVNVGAGDASKTRLTAEELARSRPGGNTASSFGAPLPTPVVRGIVLCRLAGFVSEYSSVSPGLAEHVASMLDSDLPHVPAEGTSGSGEILPLGHLFRRIPEQLDLGPKEPMALVNGAPCAGAMAVDTCLRAASIADLMERTIALLLDALNVPTGHSDPRLGEVWGYSAEEAALRTLNELLATQTPRRREQARVSVRISPRVLGAYYHALAAAFPSSLQALQHPGDNPVFLRSLGDRPAAVLSDGSFHNQRAVVTIDQVTRTLADLCRLLQHLMHAVYEDPAFLPARNNLAVGSWLMVASAWSEEARSLAEPSVLPFSGIGQNDIPNPLFAAWRRADRMLDVVVAQLVLGSSLGSQALAWSQRSTTSRLVTFVEEIRSLVPPVTERRDVGADFARLAEQFQQMSLQRLRDGHDLTPPLTGASTHLL